MNVHRSADFDRFLTAAEAAICQGPDVGGGTHAAAGRIFSALRRSQGRGESTGRGRLPVCDHLPAAIETVRHQPTPAGAVAEAFAAIAPQLDWKTRPGAEAVGEAFLHNHANATIVGSEGLEIRPDVWIGVSLMAPNTRYPDHRHPPEEIYVVLSDGEWRQASDPWHAPGIGGLVYNPPNIVHAMRSADQPLLALWFLWTGSDA